MRLGCLPYLNVKPLTYWLERNCERIGCELVHDVPSRLAQLLRTGEIAAAPVSSFATFCDPSLKICPDICICAQNAVETVLMISSKPVADVRTLALDPSSLSGANMLRIILRESFDADPELVIIEPSQLDTALDAADALLVIGDNAMLYPKSDRLVFDVGEQWRKMTGLPAVFAVWAGRGVDDGLISLLKESKVRSAGMLDEIVKSESQRLGITREYCRRYLEQVICYDMGDAERESLALFRELAHRHSLVSSVNACELEKI